MKYMLVLNEPTEKFAERNDPTQSGPYWAAWTSYIQAMYQAGIVVNGHGLQDPHTGTTIRMKDGRREVQDGPHPDSKEQLGGYFIIEVADLDQALSWAAKSPSAEYASVEVRPVLPPMNPA